MTDAEKRIVSLAEYLTSPEYERCEYEAGVVTEKPMPDWIHGELCSWIAHLLLLYFPKYKNGTEVRSRLKPESWKLPDLTVALRSAPRERYAYQAPYLNVEVLSEDDNREKMFPKCRLYHEWGVPYCWVIDGENRRVWEVNRGEQPTEAVDVIRAGEIELPVNEIFSRLDLAGD